MFSFWNSAGGNQSLQMLNCKRRSLILSAGLVHLEFRYRKLSSLIIICNLDMVGLNVSFVSYIHYLIVPDCIHAESLLRNIHACYAGQVLVTESINLYKA